VAYRHEESARLAQDMPTKDLTVAQDETFTGGLCLVQPFQGAAIFGNFVPPARSNDPVKEGQRCR